MLTIPPDLLFYLEKSSDESNGQLESYHIPTAETLSDAFPQLANVTPEFPRVIHDDISRDYFLIVQLLSILSLRKPKWSPRSANRAATRLNDGLGIDCLAGLLPSTSSAGGMASMDGLTHSYPQILQLLRLYISHLYTLRFEAATCARAVILLCRYVVWFINFLSDDQHQTLGNVVSWAIVDLFSFGRKAPAIIQLYQEHLQPVLQAAVENKPEIFTGDLQVSVASRYVSSLTLE